MDGNMFLAVVLVTVFMFACSWAVSGKINKSESKKRHATRMPPPG
jgi:hypothetical protein